MVAHSDGICELNPQAAFGYVEGPRPQHTAAFDILKRKGLQSSLTEGPFFHDLSETLHIIAEAQIRELWLEVGKVKNLELCQRSPQELFNMGEKIFSSYAFSEALAQLKRKSITDD